MNIPTLPAGRNKYYDLGPTPAVRCGCHPQSAAPVRGHNEGRG